MANAEGIVDALGGSSRENSTQTSIDIYSKNLRERLSKYKKFLNDKEKLEAEVDKRIQKYKNRLEAESWNDRKNRLKKEAAEATSIWEKAIKQTGANLMQLAQVAASSMNKGINDYLGSYSKYMTGIEARLQGTSKSFSQLSSLISDRIGASAYVKQTAVMSNLSELVKQGIGYNLELRAFLATVKDSIATTFNAFDSNLMRIIRLQQADSTAARLGIEATLTQFLNANFRDTSYLTDIASTVRGNLFEAESQLGRSGATAFDYVAQKWLGSLYSVGVSSGTISSLSQGLGYLGSGNISALSGNDALQRLLVAASATTGQDYGSLLTGGVSASQANLLMQGVVKVLTDIAQSGNQVVKSRYAELFGVSISDMAAVLNLTDRVEKISKSVLSYTDAINETEYQISQIPSRMTLQDKLNNIFENVMAGVGENIANDAVSYTTWLVADLLGRSGVDLSTTVFGTRIDPIALLKGGVAGFNLIKQLPVVLGGLFGSNQLSLSNWGQEDFISQGFGFTGIRQKGVSETRGMSFLVGDAEGSFARETQTKVSEAENIIGAKQDELLQVVRDSIASDVSRIVTLLSTTGIVIRSAGLSGIPPLTIGG